MYIIDRNNWINKSLFAYKWLRSAFKNADERFFFLTHRSIRQEKEQGETERDRYHFNLQIINYIQWLRLDLLKQEH